jgi:L-methionine (R)-S-oxide reductase
MSQAYIFVRFNIGLVAARSQRYYYDMSPTINNYFTRDTYCTIFSMLHIEHPKHVLPFSVYLQLLARLACSTSVAPAHLERATPKHARLRLLEKHVVTKHYGDVARKKRRNKTTQDERTATPTCRPVLVHKTTIHPSLVHRTTEAQYTRMTLVEDLTKTSDDNERLRLILKHFACDSGSIHKLGEDGNLHLKASGPGMPDVVLDKIRVIPVGKGMAGMCVERNDVVYSCNIQQDSSENVQPGAKQSGLQGSIVLPIRAAAEKAVGALGVASKKERTFTEAETAELMECAKIIA